MLENGTVVFDHWTVEDKIGSGAFGTVYKIKRVEYGREYRSALKAITIPPENSDLLGLKSEGMSKEEISAYYSDIALSFMEEIKLLEELKGNSNIVCYEDHKIERSEDGMSYTIMIKMELLTPLKNLLAERQLTAEEVMKLGMDICSALEVCEAKKIIHRDIKPDNIFVSDTGAYKLGDFGVARTLEKTVGVMSQKGTYTYMAPEVFLGKEYNQNVDLYSLGILLYQLLNKNRTPFLPDAPQPLKYSDREEAQKKRMSGNLLPWIKGLPDSWNGLLVKMCHPNPQNRFQNATDVKKQINNALTMGRDYSLASAVKPGAPADVIAVTASNPNAFKATNPIIPQTPAKQVAPVTPSVPVAPGTPVQITPAVSLNQGYGYGADMQSYGTGNYQNGYYRGANPVHTPATPVITPAVASYGQGNGNSPVNVNPAGEAYGTNNGVPAENKKSKAPIIIIVIALLLVVASGVIAFLLLNADDDSDKSDRKKRKTTESTEETNEYYGGVSDYSTTEPETTENTTAESTTEPTTEKPTVAPTAPPTVPPTAPPTTPPTYAPVTQAPITTEPPYAGGGYISASNQDVSVEVGEEVAVLIYAGGNLPYYFDFNVEYPSCVEVRWGSWESDGQSCYLYITGVTPGSSYATVEILEKNGNKIASVDIDISVY